MSKGIDVNFRPKSYFRPQKIEQFLLSKVQNAVMRTHLEKLFADGRHEEALQIIQSEMNSSEDRKYLEKIHPMFMGGNYLPDTDEGELEIARISILSTTMDVTCVYAKPVQGKIKLRIVDEYEGDTLSFPTEVTVEKPMTLGEFADFFLTGWPLMDVLEMNFETDVESALGFFRAQSKYYSDLDALCRERVISHFPEPDDAEED